MRFHCDNTPHGDPSRRPYLRIAGRTKQTWSAATVVPLDFKLCVHDVALLGDSGPCSNGELIAGLPLTDARKADVIAFLEALTDESLLEDPRYADPDPDARTTP